MFSTKESFVPLSPCTLIYKLLSKFDIQRARGAARGGIFRRGLGWVFVRRTAAQPTNLTAFVSKFAAEDFKPQLSTGGGESSF